MRLRRDGCRATAQWSGAPPARSRGPGNAELRLQAHQWRTAQRKRFTILAAHFYPDITHALVQGAVRVLEQHGVPRRQIQEVDVPGTFELPLVASRVAQHRPRPHAIIAVGALVRGDTPQYEVIAHAVGQGLMRVALEAGIPVTFGVIIATTLAQAHARAGGALGNRGAEAAQAAVELVRLFETLGRR